jgi:hypothetical protein
MFDKTIKSKPESKAEALTRKIAYAEKCLPTIAGPVEEHAVMPVASDTSPGRSPQFGK